MPFLGFVVKEKSDEHPKGVAVSKYFSGLSSAQDALRIYENAAKKKRSSGYLLGRRSHAQGGG